MTSPVLVPPLLPQREGELEPLADASAFVAEMSAAHRDARRSRRTVPTDAEKSEFVARFWRLMTTFRRFEQGLGDDEETLRTMRDATRQVLNPWLLRSDYWHRAWVKPHGYAGDYRMLEIFYDLEKDDCADPTRPFLLNLLEAAARTVHSVRAVWHRRGWFRDLVAREMKRRGPEPLRVLDVACGGARYLRDLSAEIAEPDHLELTLLDQDPAALAFAESCLGDRASVEVVCARVTDLGRVLDDRPPFDVILSTGLLDYLPQEAAALLIARLDAALSPDGALAVCNFHPADASRVVKEWISDWQLIYRDEEQLAACFQSGVPDLERSPDGSLLYGSLRR